MSINLDQEKNLKLTAQEVYDILDLAIQAADDNGFVSEYVYERAIYLYATIVLFPELKDEITNIISNENPLAAWQHCVKEDYLYNLVEEYSNELDFLAEQGDVWLENYTKHVHSARGLLGSIQALSTDIVAQASKRFQDVNEGSNIQDVLRIAENWGLDNKATETMNKIDNSPKMAEADSLYDVTLL